MEDLICARNRGGGARYRMIIQEQEQEQDQDPDQEAPGTEWFGSDESERVY